MNTNRSPQVWQTWKCREAYDAACARYSVAYLSARQALASGIPLAVAQQVIAWQQRSERV